MQAIEIIHPLDSDRLGDHGLDADVEACLARIEAILGTAPSLEAAFDVLVEHLEDLQFDRLGLALLDGDRVVSRRVFSRQPMIVWGPGEARPLLGSSLEPLLQAGAIRILDLQAYQQLRPSSLATKRLIEEGMRSSLTIPLVGAGVPRGFLFVTSRQPGAYGARHAAIALRLAPVFGEVFGRAIAEEGRKPRRSPAGGPMPWTSERPLPA